MARNHGAVIGTTSGATLGLLTAEAYNATLVGLLGSASFVAPIAVGAIVVGYIGRRLYNNYRR